MAVKARGPRGPVRNEDAVSGAVGFIRDRLSAWLGYSHSGERDLYAAFGYPRIVTTQELYALYLRNGFANRVINSFPAATWRDPPTFSDDQGSSAEPGTIEFSEFSRAADDFFTRTKLFRQIQRADRLASIGRFGVLFLGFQDGLDPALPLMAGDHPFLFAQPYSEIGVSIDQWDNSPSSPRFGQPTVYTLNAAAAIDLGRKSSPGRSMRVHWSRVVHIAEGLDQDEVYGVPRLLPSFNRFMDLEKVVGGSAETFWLTANRGVMLSVDPDAAMDEDAITKMKEQAEEFSHKLRRYFVGTGITAQVLGSEAPDPAPNVSAILDEIAGAVGIPKRILIGSERGQLASGQDENNWSTRIEERRSQFAQPSIIHPVVERLILTGNLPQPRGQWQAEWPAIVTGDPLAEAQVASTRATALVTYANSPSAAIIVPPQEFRKEFLGIAPESEYEIEMPYQDGVPDEVTDPTTSATEVVPVGEGSAPGPDVINAEAKSLYVSRQVLNVASFKSWARKQGIELLPDLHVTVMYSKKPVDWLDMRVAYTKEDDGTLMIHPGGPRVVSRFAGAGFGDPSAIVLEFSSPELSWRNTEMVAAGAVHSFSEYKPHITLFYDETGTFDIDEIEPYADAIALGPEIFAEVKD